MRKPKLLCVLLSLSAIVLLASSACAYPIGITLMNSSLAGTAGTTITYEATLTNLSSTDTVFLNGDGWTTSSALLTVDDSPFSQAPLSLAPGAKSGPLALFNVVIDPSAPAGIYSSNFFSILGGFDDKTFASIGTAEFDVTVTKPVPGPASLLLLTSGLLGMKIVGRYKLTRLTRLAKPDSHGND